MSKFTPSAYQEAVFEFVRSERRDAIVNAVAGSGKTTTLVEAAKLIKGHSIFCAFNKHIAEEIRGKLHYTFMQARTIHSIGFECVREALSHIRKLQPWEHKYKKIIKDYRLSYQDEFKKMPQLSFHLFKLVNMVRLTLTDVNDAEAVEQMADHYSLTFQRSLHYEKLKSILIIGDLLAEREGKIDFTDMLWLPYKWNLQPFQYREIFVDEAQDLSAAQLNLVLKLREKGGRYLFCGDPMQAIFMFAGASCDSYWKIKEATNARELPLSICYRCPQLHLVMARSLVPHIEAHPEAKLGELEAVHTQYVLEEARENDLIICRRNAPLLKYCLLLIQQEKHARIRGRDVADELKETIKAISITCKNYDKFPEGVELYLQQEEAALKERKAREDSFDDLIDLCETLLICYETFVARNYDELISCIDSIFADEGSAIWFSSVHRSKGLEANRIFILEYERLGRVRTRQTDDEYQQELNLKYVALTRAKSSLFINGIDARELPTVFDVTDPEGQIVMFEEVRA